MLQFAALLEATSLFLAGFSGEKMQRDFSMEAEIINHHLMIRRSRS